MKRTDREDAVARALDLLPTDDPARGDPRIVRDAALLGEARATREAAADVWLAVSPLRAAPPDVLHSVMEKIGPPASTADRRHRFIPWIAASGWAAAVVIAVSLWPHWNHGQARTETVAVQGTGTAPSALFKNGAAPVAPASPETRPREKQLREELMRLRNTVADLRDEQSVSAPRVMSLSAPGSIQRSPEETRERVWAVLTHALRTSLAAESGSADDPVPLVIESGWLPNGFVVPDEDIVLKHRNFPEDSWREFGLLRSDEGDYYDPAHQILWLPDPADMGGFIGTKAFEPEIDLAAYKRPDEVEDEPKVARRREPEGFVIEDPVTNKAEVVIDRVSAPAEGNKQVLMWTDVAGNSGTIDVGTVAATANRGGAVVPPGASTVELPNGVGTFSTGPQLFANTSIGSGSTYMISASVANPSSLSSFQLVEVPIIAGSKPGRVIVEGGRRRAR